MPDRIPPVQRSYAGTPYNFVMTRSREAVEIDPVDFRVGNVRRNRGSGWFWKRVGGLLATISVAGLALVAWYVTTARIISIQVEPVPDRLSLEGGLLRIRVGDQILVRPGSYRVRAAKGGYSELDEDIEVTGERESFSFELSKLPGMVSFLAHPLGRPQEEIQNAVVTVSGVPIGRTPVQDAAVDAGGHEVKISAERYQGFSTNVLVSGMGARQEFRLPLTPGWADVYVGGEPAGAVIYVDGASAGTVPLETEMFPGSYEVTLKAKDYQSYSTQVVVVAHQPVRIEEIRLVLADAVIHLASNPEGALVTANGEFAGKTPLQMPLRPRISNTIQFSKAGYRSAERKVRLEPNEEHSFVVTLEPVEAMVLLQVEPADAELVVDGRPVGTVPKQISLTSVPHEFEFRKDGFLSHRTTLTPRAEYPQELNVRLVPADSPGAEGSLASDVTSRTGYELKRVEPGSIIMGASRREQGRRSNETLRSIKLTHPFYMGAREVTNREFRFFRRAHNSGFIRTWSLNDDDQPVVNVSWADAALFCNWMSEKEGLPKVYETRGEEVVARMPGSRGYRLPTEAEWAYCARSGALGERLKFPWGTGYPPGPVSGNYADASSGSLLANCLSNYRDGYVTSAPPGSFGANRFGVFDLGGNVAEWCNDYYRIYQKKPGQMFVDPWGPQEGRFYVIRGSSWKQSGVGPLRLSYRDYGREGRNDVGFRVCRTAMPG